MEWEKLIPKEQMEWFREGVTEYLSIQVQALNGSMSKNTIEKKIENSYRRYFLSTVMGQSMSLQRAGDNKHKNRMKVYGLGTFFSLILDIEIRSANVNKAGLREVLRSMYQDFAMKDKMYSLEDIIKYVNKVAEIDLTLLFDKYVMGTEILNPKMHLAKAGLQITKMYDETYIAPSGKADNLAKKIRRSIYNY
ncbi:hypothetical protein GTQ34_14455 [Muricauda sp. JGD-17]|uniref:Uncharacterized protein n=1 Tax=Flagellimonas ochracea TaxID=2696472 RepID=A0A964WYF1_9FLAO|nr:hypothetical protein [Allomuricauda ochracea]NAY93115.1 hypothetical protein [Allomuricauda ochracea]